LVNEEKQFLAELTLERRKVEEFYFVMIIDAKKKKNVLELQVSQMEQSEKEDFPFLVKRPSITGPKPSFKSQNTSYVRANSISNRSLPVGPPEQDPGDSGVHLLRKKSIFRLYRDTDTESGTTSDNDDQSEQGKLRFQLKSSVSHYLTQNSPEIARNQVKKAFLELYRSLELLKTYRELNLTAYAKIVKKFDKNTNRKMKDALMHELHNSKFFLDRDLGELMHRTEDLFRVHFADGSRARAMKSLRTINVSSPSSIFTLYPVFTAGICTGLNIMLIYNIIRYLTFLDTTARDHKNSLALIYFGLGFPIFNANLFALNMHVWDVFKVNYRLIFGVKPTTSSVDYFAFVALLGTVYLSLASVSLFSDYDESIPVPAQVWLTIAVILVLFFNNRDLYDSGSKKWLANVLYRIVVSPAYACRFKDFFIADQLVSIAPFYQSFGLLVDISLHGTSVTTGFSNPHTWYIAVLPMLPFLFRCFQCLRRYFDGSGPIQLYNFLRYCLGIVVLLLVGFQTMYKEKEFLVYLLLSVRLFYSLISLYWDINMDWGLGQGRMKIKPTEKQVMIAYPPWTYYAVIIIDGLTRFIWLPFLLFQIYDYHASYGSYILGIIEILRRFVWNFVRVEIEHVHNCEKYLVTEELHLPFATRDLFEHEKDEDDNEAEDDPDEDVDGRNADRLPKIIEVSEKTSPSTRKPFSLKNEGKESSRVVPFETDNSV
jgi:hypothetical protein